VFQSRSYIERTLCSVIDQNYSPLEHLGHRGRFPRWHAGAPRPIFLHSRWSTALALHTSLEGAPIDLAEGWMPAGCSDAL